MNPYTSKEDLYAAQKRIRDRNKLYVLRYLEEHPCVECGEDDPIVLEFDHLDPSTKKFTVSRMTTGTCYSLAKVREEMDKCQVLCANCHRRKTFREQQLGKGREDVTRQAHTPGSLVVQGNLSGKPLRRPR